MYLAPPEYFLITPEQKGVICNGCGPGNWKLDLVPDDLLGVDIEEPCNIHDFEYWQGIDRKAADKRLRTNIEIACREQHPGLIDVLIPLASVYYLAVRMYGAPYFGKHDG